MRTKLVVFGLGALLLAAIYVAGWLPERNRRIETEGRTAALQVERDDAEERLRVARLLGDILMLEEVVANRNYGQAEQLASRFFDAVRAEGSSVSDAGIRAALNEVQGRRDEVTAALARTDPAVATILKQIEVRLRSGIGYPVPQ
jgi:hypothetical protein